MTPADQGIQAARDDARRDATETETAITISVCQNDLLTDGQPTRAAVERYVEALESALESEYPGAHIVVRVQWDTSGGGHASVDSMDWRDNDRVRDIQDRVYGAWADAINDSDLVEDDA